MFLNLAGTPCAQDPHYVHTLLLCPSKDLMNHNETAHCSVITSLPSDSRLHQCRPFCSPFDFQCLLETLHNIYGVAA